MDQKDILEALRKVKHPETGNDIVSQGMVENLVVNDSKIQFTLSFSRSRDPFATSLKRACETVLAETFPQYADQISVFIKEAAPKRWNPRNPNPAPGLAGSNRLLLSALPKVVSVKVP